MYFLVLIFEEVIIVMGDVAFSVFALVRSRFRKRQEDKVLYDEHCKRIDELVQKYADKGVCLNDWDHRDLEEYGRCCEAVYFYRKKHKR